YENGRQNRQDFAKDNCCDNFGDYQSADDNEGIRRVNAIGPSAMRAHGLRNESNTLVNHLVIAPAILPVHAAPDPSPLISRAESIVPCRWTQRRLGSPPCRRRSPSTCRFHRPPWAPPIAACSSRLDWSTPRSPRRLCP